MNDLVISESEVLDTFNHGEYGTMPDGAKKATKKFNGYEIGLIYDTTPTTGEYRRVSLWKRDRR